MRCTGLFRQSLPSPLFWDWWGRSRSVRRSHQYPRQLQRVPPPHPRPRPYCADLDRRPPHRPRPAHRATPFPQITRITVVSRRAAAAMPRARRTTPTGRITAGATPSVGSPPSAPAPAASIASPSRTVFAPVQGVSMALRVSTAQRVSTPKPDSAVSLPGPDIWVASATDSRLLKGVTFTRSDRSPLSRQL